ncbi:MAG: HAMP domain-containing histidine kinase [Clostridium sp.]|uniref:sensor histidine kinase n=1 Tax=Clostridium sp. TaxID=1506 RepID=UPI0025C268ED|nr:HAMP domain-containing sensor histidine kinase [Clostridium sp.]MCE5221990.1 HAMP domain-containing histidine kinase [Clostridium sp.]
MKSKKIKRSVTAELFFIYFLGYIAITIILIVGVLFSIVTYEILCSPSTYNSYFKELENKLNDDYTSITDKDLLDIDAFIIKINNESEVSYSRGNVIEEFKSLNLQSYMYLAGLTKENEVLLNDDLRAYSMLENFNNSIIETKDNIQYSLYSKYLQEENSIIVVGCPYLEITKPNIFTKIIPHNIFIKILILFNVLLILLIVYVFAKATSKLFIKPIKTLLNGGMEITNNNYDVNIKIDTKNEFLDLANGFNMMAETIRNEIREKEKLEKIREGLILDISHDLKNPLTSILGYSETLINNRELDENEKMEYLNIINKNSYRANKLMNNLFEFSLYDNSDYKFNLIKTDISEFMRETIASYIPEFEHNKFEYDFDIPEESYYVMIDEEKLTRAINNILDNKIKYNSAGSEINVRAEIRERYFCIVLSDNGESIPEEYRENIFNLFVRLDKSRNSKTGGTGLGLSITKKIINKHNGGIRIIDSIIGTSFEIMLPIIKVK